MFNIIMFAERLADLFFENKLNAIMVAQAIGVSKSTVYRYLNAERMPGVEMLTKLADYFGCTLGFLIGADHENYATNFGKCPPFSERLRSLLKEYRVTKYKLTRATGIPESIVYTWQNGQSQPNIESVIKLAEYFNCSVDYILGRC